MSAFLYLKNLREAVFYNDILDINGLAGDEKNCIRMKKHSQ